MPQTYSLYTYIFDIFICILLSYFNYTIDFLRAIFYVYLCIVLNFSKIVYYFKYMNIYSKAIMKGLIKIL